MAFKLIWLNSKFKLVFMERNLSFKKNGYITKLYLKCLEETLLFIYKKRDIFQQNGA